MYNKILTLSIAALTFFPTLKMSEIITKIPNKKIEKNSLFAGLDLIKTSVEKIYEENSSIFDETKDQEAAFSLYQKILNNQKNNVQKAYEDKFDSRWYWFGYWKWYATWNGFISTINDMTGAGLDAYDMWSNIKPALTTALLTYLGTSGAIPVIGWIMGGAALSLAISIASAVGGHQLWRSPQNEWGIVMSFYLVFYTGSWSQ